MSRAPLTLGTAGHIDHGKSALIRALTGVDTDRLPEEHARGISIELGYARLQLPSGRRVSIVDVPGHERYVRTMVAGATGIDLYLMAIAADDGVMPQTREHVAVLQALDVDRGVVAVTKSDLADPELAMLEAGELLPEAEVVAVSARTGAGLDELRAAIDRVAAEAASRSKGGGDGARLHIDRVFTIRGAGTVVTGTLWSGEINRGDALQVLPGLRRARAREVQVHDQRVERAQAGQRVAVNLSGVGVGEVDRGDVLVSAGHQVRETYLIDAELGFEDCEPSGGRVREPAGGERVQVHHGTRETPARLAWLGGAYWQLRLERPLVAVAGDRLVVRQIAPPDTLGGGRVLDPKPRKHGPSRDLTARLARLARGEAAEPEAATAREPGGQPEAAAAREPGGKPESGAAPAPQAQPAPLSAAAVEVEERLRAGGHEPPLDSGLDASALAELRAAGRAVRVTQSLHYHLDVLAELTERVVAAAGRRGGSITLAQVRDELGTSRKFAQAVLEHLDAERVTIRRGDEHFLRQARTN